MDAKRFLGVLGIAFGAALVVMGAFLRWWIPEEADGWWPLGAGAVLLLGAYALLRGPGAAQRPQ